jgi:uncharacterized MnhB-related membrane protein
MKKFYRCIWDSLAIVGIVCVVKYLLQWDLFRVVVLIGVGGIAFLLTYFFLKSFQITIYHAGKGKHRKTNKFIKEALK